MIEYLEIGPVPAEEECTQVGDPDYPTKGRAECRRYIELIRRVFGNEPEGVQLVVKGFPHDFGTYYEVAIRFDDTNEQAVEWAYNVEANTPTTWDEQEATA